MTRIFLVFTLIVSQCGICLSQTHKELILKSNGSKVKIEAYDKNSEYEYAYNPFVFEDIHQLKDMDEIKADRVFVRRIIHKDTTPWKLGTNDTFKLRSQPIQDKIIYYIGGTTRYANDEYKQFSSTMTKISTNIQRLNFNDVKAKNIKYKPAKTVLVYINATTKSTKDSTIIPSSTIAKQLLQQKYQNIFIMVDNNNITKAKGGTDVTMDTTAQIILASPNAAGSGSHFTYIRYYRTDTCPKPFFIFLQEHLKEKKIPLPNSYVEMKKFLNELQSLILSCERSDTKTKKSTQLNTLLLSN